MDRARVGINFQNGGAYVWREPTNHPSAQLFIVRGHVTGSTSGDFAHPQVHMAPSPNMGGGAYLVYLHHCTVVDLMRYAPGRCFLLGGEPATCRELGKTCRVGSHVQMLRMSRSRPASLLGAVSMLGGWIELVVDPHQVCAFWLKWSTPRVATHSVP